MNLKSYTRGIGAGLIVAALVLGIGSKTQKMTDSEIIGRAKELGLIEAQTLTQIGNETQTSVSVSETSVSKVSTVASKEDEPAPEFVEKDEVTVEPIISETNSETSSEVSEESSASVEPETPASVETETSVEPEVESSQELTVEPGDSVSITVYKGDNSVVVANRCYESGLIESVKEFDKYLCANGYDRKICVGTYDIPMGSGFEDIAKIITRRK